MTVSVRYGLTAGLAAGLLAVAAVPALAAPVALAPSMPRVATVAIDLSAYVDAAVAGATPSGGDLIINAYNTVQPWVAYGVELVTWGTEYLPWPVSLVAPQANILYSGWQPFAQSLVYSLAYLVDGQYTLIGPTLTYGVQTGVNNLVQGEVQWMLSFLPPLPPLPSFPLGAAAIPRAAAARSASAVRSTPRAAAATVTTPQLTRQAVRSTAASPRKATSPGAAAVRSRHTPGSRAA